MPAFLTRAVIGIFGSLSMTMMYKLLPMGIGNTISGTNPILLTILAYFFLDEPILRVEILTILVTFVGVVMMSLGGKSTGALKDTTDYKLGILCAVLLALAIATNNILTRKMKAIDGDCLQFWHMLFGLAAIASTLLVQQWGTEIFQFPEKSTYIYMILGGIANTVAVNIGTWTI